MKYLILTSNSHQGLIERVNHYLSDGWECLGGHSVVQILWGSGNAGEVEYSQAVIFKGPK